MADSDAKLRAITLFVGAIEKTTFFSESNLDTLTTNAS